jgi:hypothetical protein
VYFAAEATFLGVTETDVMGEGNNVRVDHCTVFKQNRTAAKATSQDSR